MKASNREGVWAAAWAAPLVLACPVEVVFCILVEVLYGLLA
jgi:hypothetical protein